MWSPEAKVQAMEPHFSIPGLRLSYLEMLSSQAVPTGGTWKTSSLLQEDMDKHVMSHFSPILSSSGTVLTRLSWKRLWMGKTPMD
jgi:hypothetical protein